MSANCRFRNTERWDGGLGLIRDQSWNAVSRLTPLSFSPDKRHGLKECIDSRREAVDAKDDGSATVNVGCRWKRWTVVSKRQEEREWVGRQESERGDWGRVSLEMSRPGSGLHPGEGWAAAEATD
jgi:hypothetical protein